MVEKTRTVLLNAHTKWSSSISMELRIFVFRCVNNQWNNTPRFDQAYFTLDEKFNGLKRQNRPADDFKTFHPFGCSVNVLNKKTI